MCCGAIPTITSACRLAEDVGRRSGGSTSTACAWSVARGPVAAQEAGTPSRIGGGRGGASTRRGRPKRPNANLGESRREAAFFFRAVTPRVECRFRIRGTDRGHAEMAWLSRFFYPFP